MRLNFVRAIAHRKRNLPQQNYLECGPKKAKLSKCLVQCIILNSELRNLFLLKPDYLQIFFRIGSVTLSWIMCFSIDLD